MDLNSPSEWEDMETDQAESAEELERYRRFTPIDERDDLELELTIEDCEIRRNGVVMSFESWEDMAVFACDVLHRARTERPAREVCEHDWKDARNEVVTSGKVCVKCGAIRE